MKCTPEHSFDEVRCRIKSFESFYTFFLVTRDTNIDPSEPKVRMS